MTSTLHAVLRNIKEQIDFARELINEGADVNATCIFGDTPLKLAIEVDNANIVKLLIEKGADVNTSVNIYRYYNTPLHVAAECTQNVHILRLLINAGANVNAKNHYDKETPLHCHVKSATKNEGVCKFLLEAGADVNAKKRDGKTPLHCAVSVEPADINILNLLIEAGADLEAEEKHGETPLHVALYFLGFRNLNVLKFLLDAGADVNAINKKGETPLNNFLQYKTASVDDLKFLLEAGYDVDDENDNGKTSLIVMIYKLIYMFKNVAESRVLIQKSIKFLIAYCDLNINVAGYNILSETLIKIKYFSNKQHLYKIIIEHLAKIKVLEISVDSRLFNVIRRNDDYRNYFTKCVQELEEAKSTKLDECWVTFFNLLVDDESKLVKYAGNERLVKDFRKKVKTFPIYEDDMQSNMSEAIEKRKLFDEAAVHLHDCCPIFGLDHLVIWDVLTVLSIKDWEKLSQKKM